MRFHSGWSGRRARASGGLLGLGFPRGRLFAGFDGSGLREGFRQGARLVRDSVLVTRLCPTGLKTAPFTAVVKGAAPENSKESVPPTYSLIDFLRQPIGQLWHHDWPVLHCAMLAAAEQPQVTLLGRLVG